MSFMKRKDWPKFLMYVRHMVIQNTSNDCILAKLLNEVKLGKFVIKRMHGPKGFIVDHFVRPS